MRESPAPKRSVWCGSDVGQAEVGSLEEEFFAGFFGQGIGDAITKVEASWMAAFAESCESLSGNQSLGFCERYDLNAQACKYEVEIAYSAGPDA